MPQPLLIGDVALRLGVPRHRLARFADRRNNTLPGLVRIGPFRAFEVAKLDELRDVLVENGLIKPAAGVDALASPVA